MSKIYNNIRKNQGITLIALMTTIIVMLILVGVATTAGIDIYMSAQLNAFAAEFKILQVEVNELYDKNDRGQIFPVNGEDKNILELGEELSPEQITSLQSILQTTQITGFRLFTVDYLKNVMEIETITSDFYIDIEGREIVSVKGFQDGDEVYYTADQLPDGVYNPDYESVGGTVSHKSQKPTFDVLDTPDGLKIMNIENAGYIEDWKVYYRKEGDTQFIETDLEGLDLNIVADYEIKIGNGDVESDVFNVSKVESPILIDGMVKVYWDETNTEIRSKNPDGTLNEHFDEEKWYAYINTDSADHNNESKWANVITGDGSYWVWIPRFEYTIEYVVESSRRSGGDISINFISVDDVESSEGYTIHPAFQDGSKTPEEIAAGEIPFGNGEWDSELAGIWVMKFEASDNGASIPKSGPGVTSWRTISMATMFTKSMEYIEEANSHLIKNSEWGAVTYLAYSEYGVNTIFTRTGNYGLEIEVNDNPEYLTGGGEGDSYKTNILQSTTGNITGIYDMSGGANEYVAAYIANGHWTIPTNSYFSKVADSEYYKTGSSKYVTVYPHNVTSETNWDNYSTYATLASDTYAYGDAMYETSTAGGGTEYSWFYDRLYYPSLVNPGIARGGVYSGGTDAGLFGFHGKDMFYYTNKTESFRVTLAI